MIAVDAHRLFLAPFLRLFSVIKVLGGRGEEEEPEES